MASAAPDWYGQRRPSIAGHRGSPRVANGGRRPALGNDSCSSSCVTMPPKRRSTAAVETIRHMGLTPHPHARRDAHGHRHHRQHRRRRPAHAGGAARRAGADPRHQAVQARQPRDAPRTTPSSTPPQTTIGPGTFTIIAGPCSVENEAMILRTAEFLVRRGVQLMRAGAFKPRTSPYAFQGMGVEGLEILEKAREKTGIGIVTELMDTEQRRRRRGGRRHHPDRHAQHAELQPAQARRRSAASRCC